jgi:hypothetical protein
LLQEFDWIPSAPAFSNPAMIDPDNFNAFKPDDSAGRVTAHECAALRPCRGPSHRYFALNAIDQYVFNAGVKIRKRGVQLHNAFLKPVIDAAATGWTVIDKVRCVQLIDHFRLTFLPAAFNPSARDRVYLCFCSGHLHRFLPNASPADDVQGNKLAFDGILGNFIVIPRVAQEFVPSLDLIFAKKKCGAGFIPAPQIIVAE